MASNDNSGKFTQSLNGLIDIEPPVKPPADMTPVVLSSLVISILIVTIIIFAIRYLRSARSKSRRQLKRLRNSVRKNRDIENVQHKSSYKLTAILAQGLGVNGIVSSTPLPSVLIEERDRWHRFTAALSDKRFSKCKQDAPDIDELIDEAGFWLRKWP